ncbi:YeeE/YedE thiosulfate transporter family protein [Balneolales bacterium ANBcel1]|nr:YeeE/YedE thiosulfate transporter family protein [Balneolales bacterium ANBcel1]
MFELLTQPWPWYVAGPVIGLFVPLLLFLGNKQFGISSSLRHTCAACVPGNIPFFKYDWKSEGMWNLVLVLGVFIGGFLGGYVFQNPEPIALSASTIADLQYLGVTDFSGFVPSDIFSWGNLLTAQGLIVMVLGGFLVGFGARYAGGCTSGHAISGISNLQLASVTAAVSFFIGGLIVTHLLYPLIF